MTIVKRYTMASRPALKKAREGGHAKEVAIDFAKWCKKNKQDCIVVQGTFKLDKRQENGSKEVEHYWNVLDDGMVQGPPIDNNTPGNMHKMLVDLSGQHDFVTTGLALDLDRNRYVSHSEIKV